jgi:hypothetical protein
VKVHSIRDFLAETTPLEPARTPAEEKVGVALPGDTHVSARPYGDNPYMNNPLAALDDFRAGKISQEQVWQAVKAYEQSTGERVSKDWFTKSKPQELPPDKVGIYKPPFTPSGSPFPARRLKAVRIASSPSRLLQISARIAAEPEPVEPDPIDSKKVEELVILLKRQLDLLVQAASRDNPQRAMKLLEGSYSALQTLMTLLTKGHEEVEKRRELVDDKIDQVMQNIRPIRTQIH